MKRFLRWFAILGVLSLLIGAGSVAGRSWWKERSRVRYREAEVTRGRIVAVVNSTGTVKPVRSVQVGSFVSGPIKKIFVDFNDPVVDQQILAKIDPQIYEANVARDKATLATREAEVKRAEAQLQQARNDEARAVALRK